MNRIPGKIGPGWLFKNMDVLRNQMQYIEQHKGAKVVSPSGKIVGGLYSHRSQDVVYDLREVEVAAEPLVILPPVLSVAEDDPNQELDVTWTLPDTYDTLLLERSEDQVTWTVIATLAGTATSYDDSNVTVSVREYYKIRGTVGGAYGPYSNIDDGMLTPACIYYYIDEDMNPSGWDVSLYFNNTPSTTFAYVADTISGEDCAKLTYSVGAGGSINPGHPTLFENCYLFKKQDWLYTPADCGTVTELTVETLGIAANASGASFSLPTKFVVWQGSNVFIATTPLPPPPPFASTQTQASWTAQFSPYTPNASYFNRYDLSSNYLDNTGPDPDLPMEFGFMFIAAYVFAPAYPLSWGLRNFELTISI